LAALVLANAERKANGLRQRLATAERKEEMRFAEQDISLTAPGPDWVLTVFKVGGLRFGKRLYRNGEAIDPGVVAASLNAERLSSYLKWKPRAAVEAGLQPKPAPIVARAPAPAPKPKRDPLVPPELCVSAKTAMWKIAAERGISIRECIDKIDSNTLLRAVTAWATWRHAAKVKNGVGEYVSIDSGEGTLSVRRVTDDFYSWAYTAEEAEQVAA
jgi:hypothetical protein